MVEEKSKYDGSGYECESWGGGGWWWDWGDYLERSSVGKEDGWYGEVMMMWSSKVRKWVVRSRSKWGVVGREGMVSMDKCRF